MKFFFLLGKLFAEAIAMLNTTSGDAVQSENRFYQRLSPFKNGEKLLKANPVQDNP